MSQHALLSPSSAETWMGCPGSAAMQRGLPDDSNEYSDEGTAAHLLGSTCLEKGTDPSLYVGRTILVGSGGNFDGAEWVTAGTTLTRLSKVRRTYIVDVETADHITKYVTAVRRHAGTSGVLLPEQRIGIGQFTGEKDAAGTSDAGVIHPRELGVHDLKYGMGVRVYAEKNKQLMLYALGVRDEMDLAYGPFDTIRLVIHQPRLDHISEWDCTAAELDAFAVEVKQAAAKALKLYNEPMPAVIGDNCLALNPSDDACRWCKAKPTCPALARFVQESTASDFEAVAPAVPAAADELSKKMAAIPLIESWCKSVRAEVERRLFAGEPVDGWKVVQGKQGNRQFGDEKDADNFIKRYLSADDRYTKKLITAPQAEKLLKAIKEDPTAKVKPLTTKAWETFKGLITQKAGGPSVAPASDPRPVCVPPATVDDFSPIATTEGDTSA
ncbi:MAG: DUF2800 domain-containing protein [Betaproteobacteria bacterium]